MHQRLLSWLPFVIALTLCATVAFAQETCAAFVDQVLAQVGENCNAMESNSACYGYNLVNVQFASTAPENAFNAPADQVELEVLRSIQTTGYDAASDIWGVAVLQVQADIPNTLPGQNVTFVLMGDATLENAVAPEDAVLPVDGVPVILSAGANIHSGPEETFNVVGGAQRGTELVADGLSESGAWVRVVWQDRVGWVPRRLIEENAAVDELPTLQPQQRAPMQSFIMQTGIGSANCQDVTTDALLIQGPRDIEVDLTVNGANIRVGSTVLLTTPDPQSLEFAVIDGQVTILDENYQPTNTVIRSGQSSTTCLSEDGRSTTCPFAPPQNIDLGRYGTEVCTFQSVPGAVLNYAVDPLCPGDPLPTQPVVQAAEPSGASPSQVESVDCSAFELVGPFDGIDPRFNTFQWTEAPGATEYFVVFYDYLGNEAGAYPAEGTSLTLLMGDVPTGSELQWEVRAYANGQYACASERTPTITRLADPNPPPPSNQGGDPTPPLIEWRCINATTMRITWNLPPGSDSGPTITFNDNANGIFPNIITFQNRTGQTNYTWPMPVPGFEVDSGLLEYDPPGPNMFTLVNFGVNGLDCG